MVIRFFILQAQYRGTLDFSNEALIAAEKGYLRLMEAYSNINKISPSATSTFNIDETRTKSFEALNDDLNTPIVLAQFFELVKVINAAHQGTEQLTNDNLASIRQLFDDVIFNILGLEPIAASTNNDLLEKVIGLILEERMQAKLRKDYEASDRIRNKLNEIGIEIKDTKNGSEWKIK